MESSIPTIRISVFDGDRLVREEVFNQKTVRIGKAGQAHLRIADPNVSRQHAVIEVLDSGDVRLTDLESTNGTLLNGERTTQALLRSGDEIVVGTTRLVVNIVGLAAPKSASDAFYQAPAIRDEGALSGAVALEIAVLWHEELVTVHHFPRGVRVRAGDRPGCRVFLPGEYLGASEIDLAVPEDGTFLLNVKGTKAEGDCLIQGEIIKVADLERRGRLVNRDFLRLDVGTKARLRLGPFTLMVSMSNLPEQVRMPLSRRLNVQDHVYSAISLILHLLFLILITLIPEEQLRATRDPYERRSQAFKMIQVAELEKLAQEEMARRAQEEERRKQKEQKIETTDRVAAEKPRVDVKKPDELLSKLTPEEIRERDKRIAEQALTRVLSQQHDLLSQVLGAGGDPTMSGSGIRVLGSHGPGTLISGLDPFGGTLGGGGTGGFRGTPGGMFGGSEFGPADLKGVSGLEKDGSRTGVRIGFGGGGGAPVVYTGAYSVTGELDKETVRRYIQSKMNQIRWCYQQEVQRNPDLTGQVVYQWIITPTGKVIGVKVASSSLNSPSVEECIMSRIATWVFPSPKGGGTVKVTYPFIFRVTK